MRRSHLFTILLFIIALILFAGVSIREKLVKDHSMPQIHMDTDSIKVSVEAEEEEILKGVTASDKKDGDITDSLTVENMSNFIEKGRRNVTITAADKDNHVSKVTRKLTYTDYTSPQFSLSAPLYFKINETEENIMKVLSVKDVLDGDLTRNITARAEKKMSIEKPGDYPVTFSVINSAGDMVELPVTMTLYDPKDENGAIAIELSKYLINVKKGAKVNLWKYVSAIQMNGRRFERASDDTLRTKKAADSSDVLTRDEVKIESKLNTKKPGTYEVTYSIEDEDGNTGSVRLVICVQDED